MDVKRIVIIGGVAGGGTAAARARRESENTEIIILEKGPYVSFANCGLPYYIAGIIKDRSQLLLQTPESFKDRYNVDVRINSEVVSIDRPNKTMTVVDESSTYTLPYDTLVLTQGGTPIKPPISGADEPHVFTLWTVPDVDAIHQFIGDHAPQKAVVVGAGFIGIEMAEALTERGIEVTLIERLPQVMPNLDVETSDRVAAHLGQHGVRVITGTGVETIGPKSVGISTGEEIPSDLVLLSVGVSPTVSLARDAGLDIGKTGAVLVNEYMRTSDPDIYCAGDMAEIINRVTGQKAEQIPLAGPANRQGRIAGANASGAEMKYDGSIGTSVAKVFDATVGSAGLSSRAAKEAGINVGAVVIHRDHHAGYYPGAKQINFTLLYDRDNGIILGAQAFGYEGVDKRIDTISMAVYGKLTLSELAEVDLSYAPPYSSANDIVNMAAFVGENDRSGYSSAITAEDLFDTFDADNDTILDVRTNGEWDGGHIEGALHIPVDDLRSHISEIPHKGRIFVHCHVGFRAHVAVRIIMQHGYNDVFNVTGGWLSMKIARNCPAG